MTFIEKLKLSGAALLLALVPMSNATATKVDDSYVTNNRQITCLTDNAYFEARGQSTAGKYAVMHVVMNRAKDSRFPGTPCGVVYQRTGRTCQFSWVCSGSRRVRETGVYNELQGMASRVYAGHVPDNTGGAKFFHSTRINPGWVCRGAKIIGAHRFCR